MNNKTIGKQSWLLMLLFFAMIQIISCKKTGNHDETPTPTTPATRVITPAGVEDGDPESKTIGAGGGSLSTTDGRITINIPAGALTENKLVTIQPITNNNPAGSGKAFRITPHLEFTQPVTITFSYTTEDLLNTFAEALAIAFQDNEGAWKIMGCTIDKNQKKLTVSTSHFSDWSLVKSLEMDPQAAVVDLNKSIELIVMTHLLPEDVPMPLPSGTYEQGTPKPVPAASVKEWKLNGAGTLVPRAGKESAKYTAPSSIPIDNPVAVTTTLNNPGPTQYTLVSNIYVGPDGIALRIDNGQWMYGPAPMGVPVVNGRAVIQGGPIVNNQPAGTMIIHIPASAISSQVFNRFMGWGTDMPWFLYGPGGQNTFHQYMGPGLPQVSPGGISMNKYNGTENYVMGTFYLDRAGEVIPSATGVTWVAHRIEGYFKVKKN